MARPRQFEEDEALGAAMRVFWRHGYEATTYRLLEQATGIGRRSLINVFGDKDALFLRVLSRYRIAAEAVIGAVFDPPGRAAILAFFGALGARQPLADGQEADDTADAGCLMVNTVFELGRTHPRVRSEVDAYRALWRATFERSLRADGIAQAEERAEFLLGVLWGALSQIRLAGEVEAAAPLAEVARATIEGW